MELIEIIGEFEIHGTVRNVMKFGEGMINSTYRVSLNENSREYVLQQINHKIFRDVELLQNNVRIITDHIRQKLVKAGETDITRKVLTLIPTKTGQLFYFDKVNYWRMTILIPESKTFEAVTPQYAYAAGKAFGKFQSDLSDLPDTQLGESIPNFHNMEYRLEQFRDAVKVNAFNRMDEVGDLVYELEKRADEMCKCERLFRAGVLPKRINHCDTKVNNILFDEQGKVLCVIDLDTAMPGFVVSDFGDFMRTAGNTGKEDDENVENVNFNMEIFRAYTQGYLESARDFLTDIEIELLPFGARLLTYMQLSRFLADYLNGDVYYRIKNPKHNLQRSNAQFKLLQSIEQNYAEMQEFIKSQLN